MGFQAFESSSVTVEALGVVFYNMSCDPNPGMLPNGTNATLQAILAECEAVPENCTLNLTATES